MVDWIEVGFSTVISVVVTFVMSYIAFRVEIERRLVRVESAIETPPIRGLDERLRAVETRAAMLNALDAIVTKHGTAGVERLLKEE